ncbi:hypothetical protein OCC_07671 [Thermococcus litoralis DSM 5473]|uniref:Uncharacterized protein n=2 Tax=Thermococcus litoralis TaxID=2265 RepID=H3ZL21_THELN|nr:hypothetical protein [Thermococcus litoralis]EHR79360.1 hypothetical protein OCC_07671 [Thermococcus litoralis DSM 5473]
MLLAHRKKKGYVVEKGLFGREKKIEQEYLYEKHIGLTPLADNALGKALGTDVSTHTLSERFATQTL